MPRMHKRIVTIFPLMAQLFSVRTGCVWHRPLTRFRSSSTSRVSLNTFHGTWKPRCSSMDIQYQTGARNVKRIGTSNLSCKKASRGAVYLGRGIPENGNKYLAYQTPSQYDERRCMMVPPYPSSGLISGRRCLDHSLVFGPTRKRGVQS